MKMSTLLTCVTVGAKIAATIHNPTRAIERRIRHIPAPAPPVPPRQPVTVIAINVQVDDNSTRDLQEILRRPLHVERLTFSGLHQGVGFRLLANDIKQAVGLSIDSVARYAALNLMLLKSEIGELDADDIYNVVQSGLLFQLYPQQLAATESSFHYSNRLIENLSAVRRQVREGDLAYRDMMRIADTLNRL